MPFRDSIVAGVGNLIRTYIRSPNYVAGVSGWTINKDGSAEFNNATFRGSVVISAATQSLLVYSGAPAAGNLILAISPLGGADSFGNIFNSGLTVTGDPTTAKVTFIDDDGVTEIAQITTAAGTNELRIRSFSNSAISLQTGNASRNFMISAANGFRFGSSPFGLYYAELVTLEAPAGFASGGALKPFTGFTSRSNVNDYPSGGFSVVGGQVVWTAPDDGWYLFTMQIQYAAWVGGSVTRAGLSYAGAIATAPYSGGFIANDEHPSTNNGRITISCGIRVLAGDVIQPLGLQATGAIQGPDAGYCYMSVKRFLP